MTIQLETWPLSRKLLLAILSDNISDRFVAKLVWYRLGYQPVDPLTNIWLPTKNTAEDWKQSFQQAPEIIANRKVKDILQRLEQKIYIQPRPAEGKRIVKIIKNFLKIKCPIQKAPLILNN